jgi:hypothetical protein
MILYSYALIGVDCFSKIAMCSTTLCQSENHVWESLKEWFEKYSAPKVIRSDNGGPFITEGKREKL